VNGWPLTVPETEIGLAQPAAMTKQAKVFMPAMLRRSEGCGYDRIRHDPVVGRIR
jgi:hypothetical protein